MGRDTMRKPKIQILGQIALWDLPEPKDIIKQEILSPDVKLIENENDITIGKCTEQQSEFLNKNKAFENESLSRVIKYCGGGLGIEYLSNGVFKTDYVNKDGINEFTLGKSEVLPMDKIIFHKGNFSTNELQEKKLKEIKGIQKVIKRAGDENIIVLLADKVISINSKGWVLEFFGVQAIFDLSEVQEQEGANDELKVGDNVEVQYGDEFYKGVVTSIYNGGNTINCIFDNRHTAFYKTFVKKLNAAS